MRILFVAALHHPEALPATPRHAASPDDPLFPPTQSQHFWVRALRRQGHACAVFWRSASVWPLLRPRRLRATEAARPGQLVRALAARWPALNPDYRLRNRRLLRAAETFRPDVIVLIGGNHVIVPRTLAALKERLGATLVYASGTSPIVFSLPLERAAARLYDLVVTNDLHHAVQWRELGAPRAETLPLSAVDPTFHHTYQLTDGERADYAAEVAFVGTLVPRTLYDERVTALEALKEFDLAIWSIHEVPASLRRFHRGALLGEPMLRVLSAAAISVNPHGDFMRHGGNLRLFELCGIGAFQLTDDRPGTRQWFVPGEHLAVYRDPADLRQLVGHYLAHPDERRRIAAAGQAHVHRHHTYDERMARLTALIGEVRAGRG